MVVTVVIDLSEAKVFLDEIGREGGGRLRALWEWARGFAGRGLEALLRMELALMLDASRRRAWSTGATAIAAGRFRWLG